MSTRSRSTLSADTVKKKGKGVAGRVGKISDDQVQELVRERRESLLSERQAAVERVLDNHDNLVREAFHMENFTSLLAYDPKIAKEDVSAVFQEYKAKYDLVAQSTSAGPSRSTRQAHNDRKHALQSQAPPSISAPPRPSAKSKKPDTTRKNDTEEPPNNAFWSIMSNAKSREKGKARADSDIHSPSPSITTKKNKFKSTNMSLPILSDPNIRIGPPKHRHRKRPPDPSGATETNELHPSPRKKRKVDHEHAVHEPESISAALPKRTPRKATSTVPGSMSAPYPPTSNSSQTPIRRVKLIVRRPPPVYSHYAQRPPPAKHGASISAFLDSYESADGQDLTPGSKQTSVSQKATFWAQVDGLRKAGRLPFLPYLDGIDDDTGRYVRGSTPQPEREPDLWDAVVEEVVNGSGELINTEEGARKVAYCVHAHWASRGLVDIGGPPEMRKGELQRLKAMAKSTAAMVIHRWKEALMHVREEEQRRIREEEERLGREHLDAILDQSGKILEAQQADLTRDYSFLSSRSSSAHSVVSDEEDEDEDERDSDDETETAESDNEGDTGLLLGDSFASSLRRSASEQTDLHDRETSLPIEHGEHPASSSPAVADDEDHGLVNAASSPDEPPQTPGHDEGDHPTPRIVDGASIVDQRMGSVSPLSRPSELSQVKEQSAIAVVNGHLPDPTKTAVHNGIVPPSSETTAPDAVMQDTDMSDDRPALDTHALLEKQIAAAMSGDLPSESAKLSAGDEEDADEDIDAVDYHSSIPLELRRYAVAPTEWDPQAKVQSPRLLRGTLRPYQQSGLEWLASLHTLGKNGILADEMGLGKTIQTISLLAHLACDQGIWGPHLIVVPTSVLLNWEMEFKKFLPGFKVLSYHGNQAQRRELRQGWYDKYNINVCVTSYTLALKDGFMFKRKPWYYMILDEAHMIKNYNSQRWQTLLQFTSRRRLLLTGTPLQNNLTELWALLKFLLPAVHFANVKEFNTWFSIPLEKAIEMGTAHDLENQEVVSKLHTVLRPYLLRRLKRDVEKELPSKFEHLVMCPLSKRQRFLYDEFMARAQTRHDLQSGVYQKVANILMQLRKVVNHPDLFEVRPIKTSFAMQRSVVADFEIKELLLRRQLLKQSDDDGLGISMLGLRFTERELRSRLLSREIARLHASYILPHTNEEPGVCPPKDTRTIAGYRKYRAYEERFATIYRWKSMAHVNFRRCCRPEPVISEEDVTIAKRFIQPLIPLEHVDRGRDYLTRVDRAHAAVKSLSARTQEMADVVDRFSFVTPPVVARGLATIALSGAEAPVVERASDLSFDAPLHRSSVKLQIAFPDPSLLQYDCGKLQELAKLLRERKDGKHRCLIFTQMTRILDILETFLNLHGYLYLRLDGATKIEDRQYITERFNSDDRIFCFISSSRSGGVGINLTGADTVIFYDSDFNPQMDRQCEDRAHRIGQIRDVHIYRFVSAHTVEEALLRKANQKRSLDDLVIQKGEFDWQTLFKEGHDERQLTKALGEFEDLEDARAARVAEREEVAIVGADEQDFRMSGGGSSGVAGSEKSVIVEEPEAGDSAAGAGAGAGADGVPEDTAVDHDHAMDVVTPPDGAAGDAGAAGDEDDEEGGTTVEYMLSFINYDMDYFNTWSI
ncbi:swr1 complex component [Steccherinum ochraceum]|uniref:DNA helicase n=1 Tax=Steccherinum ochraceum TaxID=92696 RepID=A0A4R0RUD3_9APHY|nr:swr1 complex component [Steccherinum ochraceum]